MNIELSLGFEDVAIKQKKNLLKSRLDANIRSEFVRGLYLDVPLIAANMSTVFDSSFCIKLSKLGALGIMHRAAADEHIVSEVRKIAEACPVTAASIGVGEGQMDLARKLFDAGALILTIDIAHGYSDYMIEFARALKKELKDVKLILGNTTNIEMMKECSDIASALKCGIAQGYVCQTKNTAGTGEKQFSTILKFKEISKEYGIPIISDGAVRESADVVKAIAAGANSVMAGKIFAECPESAGEVITRHDQSLFGVQKKLYAGMASEHVQKAWRGGLKPGTCAEGGVRYLDMNSGLNDLIEHYAGALKSGITYGGGVDIASFQNSVEFVRFR